MSSRAMHFYQGLLLSIGIVAVADTAVEFTGRRYLRDREQWRIQEAEKERARLQSYHRVAPTENVVEQNAAVWYRLALARSARQPAEDARDVALGTAMLQPGDEPSLARLMSGPCRESTQGARMREALRSSMCDWELTSIAGDRPEASQALLVGNCLVVEGHWHAVRRQWAEATDSYRRALSFAGDLGQGDFSMNLVGMAVAKAALDGFGALARTAAMPSALWARIGDDLARFEAVLPSTDAGIRLARLSAAANVEIDARTYIRDISSGVSWIWPSAAAAGWHVSRAERLLDLLQQTSDARTQQDREGLAAEVDRLVRASHSETIRDSIPDNLVGAVKSELYLVRIYRSIRAAIELQQRRLAEGRFPANAATLTPYLESKGLHYESSKDGDEYRIVAEDSGGSHAVIVTGHLTVPAAPTQSPKRP